MFGEVDDLTIFEGVLRATFGAIGDADCCREDSDTFEGVRNIETGNCGRAEVGGGRIGWVMLTSVSGSCEQASLCICSAGGTEGKEEGKLLDDDDGPFVRNCQSIPSCSSLSPEEAPVEEFQCYRDQMVEDGRLGKVE